MSADCWRTFRHPWIQGLPNDTCACPCQVILVPARRWEQEQACCLPLCMVRQSFSAGSWLSCCFLLLCWLASYSNSIPPAFTTRDHVQTDNKPSETKERPRPFNFVWADEAGYSLCACTRPGRKDRGWRTWSCPRGTSSMVPKNISYILGLEKCSQKPCFNSSLNQVLKFTKFLSEHICPL